MQLNPAAFNAHLQHMGQALLWRRAFQCPCRNAHSGAAKPNCPRCSGKGIFWGEPVQATAGVASQSTVRKFAQIGQWLTGDALFSIPENSPLYAAGKDDRIQMLNSTDRFSMTLTRGQNDRLQFHVKAVDNVFWLDTDGFTMVQGGIPTVGDGGVLTWSSGEPPAGKQYAIAGERFSEYFIWQELPSDRGEHHGARLPRRVQARMFDLFGKDG
jgi:hypothetical protein